MSAHLRQEHHQVLQAGLEDLQHDGQRLPIHRHDQLPLFFQFLELLGRLIPHQQGFFIKMKLRSLIAQAPQKKSFEASYSRKEFLPVDDRQVKTLLVDVNLNICRTGSPVPVEHRQGQGVHAIGQHDL